MHLVSSIAEYSLKRPSMIRPVWWAMGNKFLCAHLAITIAVKTGKVSLCPYRLEQLGKGGKLPD
jgi:hypothetical protein